MNLKKQLAPFKQAHTQFYENKIEETIQNSKKAFFETEQKRILSYREFLWIQLKIIQKKWWILQFLLLSAAWIVLTSTQDEIYAKRSLGVAASLFVILIIPELWKNRSCQCMEIEAAAYYSLRQVYAARMTLFGIADTLLIAVFFQASVRLRFELEEFIVQFLFPLCVTACICFGILCSKYVFHETVAIILCVIWSAVWLCAIRNEQIFSVIAFPVWFCLLIFAFAFLIFAIYRTLTHCNHYLEVSFDEIRT